ncbi:hypothetical protein HRbin14_01894 [bacterium HR14]|nr:hypothetical protein HRbin14_01894 [bacterium HR14]
MPQRGELDQSQHPHTQRHPDPCALLPEARRDGCHECHRDKPHGDPERLHNRQPKEMEKRSLRGVRFQHLADIDAEQEDEAHHAEKNGQPEERPVGEEAGITRESGLCWRGGRQRRIHRGTRERTISFQRGGSAGLHEAYLLTSVLKRSPRSMKSRNWSKLAHPGARITVSPDCASCIARGTACSSVPTYSAV